MTNEMNARSYQLNSQNVLDDDSFREKLNDDFMTESPSNNFMVDDDPKEDSFKQVPHVKKR